MSDFIKKYRYQIIVWAIGVLAIYLIHSNSGHIPSFIKENDIVTWSGIEMLGVVIACKYLASKRLFWTEDQDEWAHEIKEELRVNRENIQSVIETLNLERSARKQETKKLVEEIERNLQDLHELLRANEQLWKLLPNKCEALSKQLSWHLEDCSQIFRCDACEQEFDAITISNDDGDPMCANCYSCEIKEKKVIRHFQPPIAENHLS